MGKQSSLAETVEYDSSRGLVCTREAHFHQLHLPSIDIRWGKTGLKTVIVMNREKFHKATQEVSHDTSYYLSNYQDNHEQKTVTCLAKAIRKHWVVESNNWQLDVTFGEDSVRTKEGKQALIMGKLRCFSMNLIRWSKKGINNFQATIEKFTDSPDTLISMLRQVNFL